jgi:catechol 2,3-dioxygenase-like lactoylglutathione lyase family enzyme
MSVMQTRLGLVILAVKDLAVARQFYDDTFGWARTVDAPLYCERTLANGMRVGLYAREGFARNVGATPIATRPRELAPAELYVYADDPEALLRRGAAAGGTLLSPLLPRDWGDEVGYLADPDGSVIAVAAERVRQTPPRG